MDAQQLAIKTDSYKIKLSVDKMKQFQSKMIETCIWNEVIREFGQNNFVFVNRKMFNIAFKEDKILWVIRKDFDRVVPAIMTKVSGKEVSLTLYGNRDTFVACTQEDFSCLEVFKSKIEAERYLIFPY